MCRVKAKEATQEAIAKVEKRQAKIKKENSKNGWDQAGMKRDVDEEELKEFEGEDDEGEKERDEEDEEKEGYWQRSGKRVKV